MVNLREYPGGQGAPYPTDPMDGEGGAGVVDPFALLHQDHRQEGQKGAEEADEERLPRGH